MWSVCLLQISHPVEPHTLLYWRFSCLGLWCTPRFAKQCTLPDLAPGANHPDCTWLNVDSCFPVAEAFSRLSIPSPAHLQVEGHKVWVSVQIQPRQIKAQGQVQVFDCATGHLEWRQIRKIRWPSLLLVWIFSFVDVRCCGDCYCALVQLRLSLHGSSRPVMPCTSMIALQAYSVKEIRFTTWLLTGLKSWRRCVPNSVVYTLTDVSR